MDQPRKDGCRGCIGNSQGSEQAGGGDGKGGELLCLHGACRRGVICREQGVKEW